MEDYFFTIMFAVGLMLIFLSNSFDLSLNFFPKAKLKGVFERLDKGFNYAYSNFILKCSLYLTKIFGSIFIVYYLFWLFIGKGSGFSWLYFGLFVVVSFCFFVLFGYIIPSAVVMRNPEIFLVKYFIIMKILYVLFKPASKVIVAAGKFMLPEDARDIYNEWITEENLIDVIEAGEREGAIEKDEKIMLHSVIEFGDKIVREVMIPRIEVVAIDENSTVEDAIKVFSAEKYSRIPVYSENIDNIVGILYVQDLIEMLEKDDGRKKSIKTIVHEPFFVPETKHIADLFREFKKKKIHMAVVVDEYGGTSGIITLEDLIEEIVGEIQDEYDVDEEKPIKRISQNTYIVQAKALIDDVNKTLKLKLEESDDFDTIGGYIIDKLGRIPKSGDIITTSCAEIVVVEADDRSVKKVKIKKLDAKNKEGLKNE